MIESCEALKTNDNFHLFLKIVLDVGNQMNQGSAKGNAQG